jgi:Icc-related predicted phosphoesterase
MKILVIGDSHGVLPKQIPKNIELILLTGDIGKSDLVRKMAFENIERRRNGLKEKEFPSIQKKEAYMQIYNSSMEILNSLSQIAPVYIIFGNVEPHNEDVRKEEKKIGLKLPYFVSEINKLKNVRIINNRIANFNGLRIGGLEYFTDNSWIKEFNEKDAKRINKAKRETEKTKRILERFDNLDILLCHQPPFGYLDKVNFPGAPKHWLGKHAGSKVILDYIRKKQPIYVFCGHIHEAKGKAKIGKTEVYNVGSNGDYVLLNID